MCTGLELLAIGTMVASTTATAVSVSQAHQAGKAQKSAAEEASRTQERLFQESQQRFSQAILPAIPEPEVIKETAKEEAKKRRMLAAQTILTSPAGLIGEPTVFRKTLLGQ